MTRDTIRLLAEVLAGLQVPLSIGAPLGAARKPYEALRDHLHIHGWTDADGFEQALAEDEEHDRPS